MIKYLSIPFVIFIFCIAKPQNKAQGILLDDFDDTQEMYGILNYNNWQKWDYDNSHSPIIQYDSIKGNNVMCGPRWISNVDRSYMALKKYPFISFKNSFHFFQISFNLIRRSDLLLRNWATFAYFGTSFGVKCEDDSLRRIHFKISGWSNQYIEGSVDIPEPINGPVWYDLRLELDWRKLEDTEKFGFATLKYKESKSIDWAIDQNYNGLQLNYNSIPSSTYYGIRIRTNSHYNDYYYHYQNDIKFYYNSVDDIRYFGIYWDNTELGKQTQFSLADPSVVSSISWDYKDGTKSSEKEPKHTFNTLGDHPIEVTITYTDGITDSYNFVVQIDEEVKPNFGADKTSGCDSLTVFFSDESSGATSWLWDFGNGQTSVEQNPTVHYPYPGNYSVKLVINQGEDSLIKNDLIIVRQTPTASFNADQTYGGFVPFTVNFTNYSSHASNNTWLFGDNETAESTENIIQHNYDIFGIYDVTLIAHNGYCTDTLIKDSLIRIIEPDVQIVADNTKGDAPLTVNFSLNESSVDPIIFYEWDFGDGITSIGKNPKHIYTIPGSYDVSVKTTTSNNYTIIASEEEFILCTSDQYSSTPVIINPIPDTIAKVNAFFSLHVKDKIFADPDTGDILMYSLAIAEIQTLPSWIRFNPALQAIEATPPQNATGIYKLQLQAEDLDGNTAMCEFKLWVTNNYTVRGNVYQGIEPLNDGKVFLLGRNNAVHAFSYVEQGKFEFLHIDSADYGILAIPEENNNYLPTYYVNTLFWEEAYFINVYGNVSDVDIQLSETAISPTGNCKIKGSILSNDTNGVDYSCEDTTVTKFDSCHLINFPVLLFNEGQIPIYWSMTENNTEFKFNNLPLGNYLIQIQKPGTFKQNMLPVNLSDTISQIELNINDNEAATKILSQKMNYFKVYPNPCDDYLKIKLGDISKGNIIIELFNEYGIKLYHKKYSVQLFDEIIQININNFSKGIYILRIQTHRKSIFYKIIIE